MAEPLKTEVAVDANAAWVPYRCVHSKPRTPQDLAGHDCINMRLPTLGGLYAWEYGRNGRELRVRVDGRLVFNSGAMIVRAACDGFGLAQALRERGLVLRG